MSIIKPISDLRNHADQISDLCHREGEPVFITKNGIGDLVVMSQALFERQQALLEVYQKLDQADRDAKVHPRGLSHQAMFHQLRARIP